MKRSTLFSLVSACFLVVGITVNAVDKPAKGERGGKIKAEILERFDTNKDGVLDESEKAALEKHADTIKNYDKNGDGKLDLTEKAALYKAIREKKAKKGA